MGSIYLTQLEGLLRTSKSASDPQAKLVLSRIQTEIKARLSRGSPALDFFSDVAKGIAQVSGIAHAEIRMDCLYDCGQFFYYNDLGMRGLPALRHLEFLADRTKSAAWSRKANQLIGIVYADSGDITAAVAHYCKAFDLALSLADPIGETSVLVNMGIALNYGGLYREAIPCFQRAINNAPRYPQNRFLECAALTNMAQSYLYLGEFSKGFKAIDLAISMSEEPKDSITASSRAVREYTYVQLALELGQLEFAKLHAAQCTHYATMSGMLRGEMLADISNANCEIYGGNVESGIRRLEEALQRSSTISTKEDALVALVKAYDQAQQPEKSLAYLDGLIAHVQSTRAKGIAALMAIPSTFISETDFFTEDSDLKELRFKEAKLRARVAERKALNYQIEMLERFAVTADLKDEVSGEHGHRVGRLCWHMAKRLNWNNDAAAALGLAARLHDIGKVGVPDRILLKSKHLVAIEKHFISAHTSIGGDLLGKSQIPQVRMAEEVARYHHEWWNGEGYPHRLASDRIPIHARIVAIADVFDALTHGRPYADPWSTDKAVSEILARRGSQFDPNLVDVFLELIEHIRAQNSDIDAYLGPPSMVSPFAQARERIRGFLNAESMHEETLDSANTPG